MAINHKPNATASATADPVVKNGARLANARRALDRILRATTLGRVARVDLRDDDSERPQQRKAVR